MILGPEAKVVPPVLLQGDARKGWRVVARRWAYGELCHAPLQYAYLAGWPSSLRRLDATRSPVQRPKSWPDGKVCPMLTSTWGVSLSKHSEISSSRWGLHHH